jgi:hypothetical protein
MSPGSRRFLLAHRIAGPLRLFIFLMNCLSCHEKLSRHCKRLAEFNGWTLFFPIFEFQVFNSYKFMCIIGKKDEIACSCLSCDEHAVRADNISFFFEL